MSSNGPRRGLMINFTTGENNPTELRRLCRGIDALVMCAVIDRTTSTPPGSPANGDAYLVKATGTGAWAGHDNAIAIWTTDNPSGNAWEFYAAAYGMLVYSVADAALYQYNGSAWVSATAGFAPLASPAFTVIPTAPTAAPGTNTTQISTTAFVAAAIAALVASSPSTLDTLNELATALGDDPAFATTMATLIGLKAPNASPALTGSPTAPTKSPGDNSTAIATTSYTDAAVGVETTRATTAEALKASLASPALTGSPTAPTKTALDNSTKLATTAYSDSAVAIETSRAQTAEALSELLSHKDAPNGYPSLDSGGHIPLSEIPAAIVGALQYQGTWNASANSPSLSNGVGTKGFFYKVATAGNTSIDGNSGWHVGDLAIFDGTVWDKVDNYEAVTSVAGRTGAVVIAEADVTGLAADLAALAAPSGAANLIHATPDGSSGVSALRKMVLADLPAALTPTFEHFFYASAGTRNNLTGHFGCEFYCPQYDVTISQVGRRYVAGNSQNHVVKVWKVSNTTAVATGTVLAASASDAYGYKWVAVTPFTLTAGVLYRIASDETNGGDTWMDAGGNNAAHPLFNWAITGACYNASQSTYPLTNTFGSPQTYVGCGMKQ